MGFLDQSHYDIVLTQETKLRDDSEYTTPTWICVGSGTTAQKHAGVMILIRRSITHAHAVRHDAVIPGRLLRVRFPLGATGRLLSVICAYQHAWNPKDAHILEKRSEFWHKMLMFSSLHSTPASGMEREPFPRNGPRMPKLCTHSYPHTTSQR